MTVFVSPRNMAAAGPISSSTGYNRRTISDETSASVSALTPNSMSGGATPSSLKKTSLRLSE